jgi:heat-inducible transcriptional repressor
VKRLHKPITERALSVLKTVVALYTRTGQPVSSKAIMEETAAAPSSATIRHVMANLEEEGYIRAPHTSAGRVPTAQGYRVFVDYLLTLPPLRATQVHDLQQRLNPEIDPQTLLENASVLLSNQTKLAGIVTKLRRERQILRHIEFLPLTNQQVLVIMVINEREVQNKIVNVDRCYSPSELQEASNYLIQTFAGQDLLKIHQQILEAICDERQHATWQIYAFAEMADKAFAEENTDDFVMAGETHLIRMAEEAGIERLRLIFEAIAQKRDVLHLLEQCFNSTGVQVFIGEESGCDSFGTCSVVTAPYWQEGKSIGVLGVIGPTRMPYQRVISVVDATAKFLSAALSDQVRGFAKE